jgi:hypothetical protein
MAGCWEILQRCNEEKFSFLANYALDLHWSVFSEEVQGGNLSE